MHNNQAQPGITPPTDPVFLVAALIGARRSGDKTLESIAKHWLAEIGVKVTFVRPPRDARPSQPPRLTLLPADPVR